MENYCLLSTHSHKNLALQISKISKIPFIDTDIEYFANKEIRTTIKESIRGKNIFIVTSPNTNDKYSINDYIMETYLLISTCKRSDANNITLVCPCYPYARQDKKNMSRMCISAKDMADLFVNAGINRIMSYDLHSHQIQGFFNIPCDNFYCIDLIHQYLVDNYNINENDSKLSQKYVIIAPDEGSLKRVQKYASKFKMPFLVVSKERDYTQINKVDKAVLIGDKKHLVGRTAIIIDDMADTCGTVFKVSHLLMQHGAYDVIVMVTHGIFSNNALEKLNNITYISKFVVSDTLPQEENKKICDKLDVYTIVPSISNILLKIINGESLSEVFE